MTVVIGQLTDTHLRAPGDLLIGVDAGRALHTAIKYPTRDWNRLYVGGRSGLSRIGCSLTYDWPRSSRETDRTTSQEIELLKIYVLLSPLVILAFAIGVAWLTGWMDRRERRQRPAE